MNSPNKILIGSLATILMVFSSVVIFRPSEVGAATVEPVLISGNLTCAQLVPGTSELKVEPGADGTYSDGTLTVTIDVRDTPEGPVFDFTSNIGIDAVFVKGGPDGNLYTYSPETTGDTGLHAPVNPGNGKYYGLSHISFCYDVEPSTATPTVTNTPTPTNTPTDTPTSTPTNTPTNTPTDTPTSTPTSTPTDTPTPTPTNTPTSTPTNTPTPTPIAFEGCTPGYWKQSQHFDSWVAYEPTDLVQDVFSLGAYYSGGNLDLDGDGDADTLLDALNYKGGNGVTGALRILLRSAVAALLNAANPTVDYPLSPTQVIAEVNAAAAGGNRDTMLNLAARFDRYNNAGCPLNGGGKNGKAGASTLPGLPDTVESLFLPAIKR
jgi:hypothetical protein